jgi:uncharacterized protein DUF3999
MKQARAAALALCLCATTAIATETPQDFAVTAPITLEGNGPYYRLNLPIEVHLAARFPDLSDLRMFNGAGESVQFSLVRDRAHSEPAVERSEVRWFPLYGSQTGSRAMPEIRVERGGDGTVVSITEGEPPQSGLPAVRGYLLDMSANKNPMRSLELDWDPAVAGFQRLAIEASDDLQHWRSWRDAQLARLVYQGERIERRQIDLPGERAAYLRLLWREPAAAPTLTAVTLVASRSNDRPAPFVWSAPSPATRDAEGDYDWQLAQLVGAERLKIDLPDVNVLTPVEIWGKDGRQDRDPWRLLGRAVLYRLLIDGKEWQQQEIALAGQPVKEIKLRLDRRGGGIGAGMPSLAVGITAEQLLFLARGAGPFVLAIGNAQAKPIDMPPSILIPGYDTASAPPISTASLGGLAAIVPGAPGSSAAALSGLDWKTAMLWGVLVIGVACIGAMALHLLRQTKS